VWVREFITTCIMVGKTVIAPLGTENNFIKNIRASGTTRRILINYTEIVTRAYV